MSKMKNETKQVRVITFMSSGALHNDEVKNPLPEEFLSETELPKELIQEMKDNSWCDADGNVCFPTTFQPDPVKGVDGNVYLSMNDTTDENLYFSMMMKGMELLNLSTSSSAMKTSMGKLPTTINNQ